MSKCCSHFLLTARLLTRFILILYFHHTNSIDAVDEEHHMVYFSGNAPTALNERHAYVASYQPTATAR